MRTLSKSIVATSLAALLLGVTATASATASEAAFVPQGRIMDAAWHGHGWHGGGGGWHGGGWHHGWGPGAAAGIIGGLATGAIIGSLATPYAYGYGGCYQYQPVYDAAGNVIANQLVNVCY